MDAPIGDYRGLVEALRDHIDRIGITFTSIDAISGLPPNYAGKLLCAPPVKFMSVLTLFTVLQTVGLRLRLELDPEQLERLQRRSDWIPSRRRGPRYRGNRRHPGKARQWPAASA
jgi:hypothetical protein